LCRTGSAISIEDPASLASASADIRAESALTQFPRMSRAVPEPGSPTVFLAQILKLNALFASRCLKRRS